MTSISASTTIKIAKKTDPSTSTAAKSSQNKLLSSTSSSTIKSGTNLNTSASKSGKVKQQKQISSSSGSSNTNAKQPRGIAPKLEPKLFASPLTTSSLLEDKLEGEQKELVLELVRIAFGESSSFKQRTVPHLSPTSIQGQAERGQAAADVAICVKVLGVHRVMKKFGVLEQMETMLQPNTTINSTLLQEQNNIVAPYLTRNTDSSSNLRRIISTNSLISATSLEASSSFGGAAGAVDNDNLSQVTGLSNDKGKTTPPLGREGALLIIRALCEIVGPPVEPYVVPLFGAALEESSSSQGSLREVSIDTSRSIVELANPHAASGILLPFIFSALKSKEWRIKWNALERLSQLADTSPTEVSKKLPIIVPKVCQQVWDTKPQVSKAAGAALLSACGTNGNADVRPAIPAIVQAMVQPSDTFQAIEELMGTTFVHAVDASTLSLLCPVLSRGLKEKQALHKRACCLIITNMSRLVETPQAVAPFGPLLVPELKKVVDTVQFNDIREGALTALSTLSKALGHANVDDAITFYKDQATAAEEELTRLAQEKEEEMQRQLAMQQKEEEERKLWKEAQEATRLLEKLKVQEEEEKKAEDIKLKDAAKRSIKGEGGKCKSCGLKKCRKGCLFATS